MRKGLGLAHAKVILIGEHSVVYGKPAIALPLKDLSVSATIETNNTEQQLISGNVYQGTLDNIQSPFLGIKALIEALIKRLEISGGFQLRVENNIPLERGLGSSAAISNAVVQAFFDWQNQALSEKELNQLVMVSESLTHGNPSGVDALATRNAQAVWFVKDEVAINFPVRINGTLIIADTGIHGDTAQAVGIVQKTLNQWPKERRSPIDELAKLTLETKKALEENELQLLGESLNQAQEQLRQLNVSHPMLEEFIQTALVNGAIGAKLTGGGLGGAMIALASEQHVPRIVNALKANGAKEIWTQHL